MGPCIGYGVESAGNVGSSFRASETRPGIQKKTGFLLSQERRQQELLRKTQQWMVLSLYFNQLRSDSFEGPAIAKPPALSGDTWLLVKEVFLEISHYPKNKKLHPVGEVLYLNHAPPLTFVTSPVTKPARSETRNNTAPATSSGTPPRLRGVVAIAACRPSSVLKVS